jgi:hypothetical protein
VTTSGCAVSLKGTMKIRTRVIQVLAVTALLGATAAATTATTAVAADPPKLVVTHADGSCDSSTGEWVIDWSIQNTANEDAVVSNVSSTPIGSPVQDMPTVVPALSTVHAGQRIAGSGGQTAALSFSANWSDGTATGSSWQFRPFSPCLETASS